MASPELRVQILRLRLEASVLELQAAGLQDQAQHLEVMDELQTALNAALNKETRMASPELHTSLLEYLQANDERALVTQKIAQLQRDADTLDRRITTALASVTKHASVGPNIRERHVVVERPATQKGGGTNTALVRLRHIDSNKVDVAIITPETLTK